MCVKSVIVIVKRAQMEQRILVLLVILNLFIHTLKIINALKSVLKRKLQDLMVSAFYSKNVLNLAKMAV